MSELLVLRRPRPPAIVPLLLSFAAGFIDSFTVLALFGLFVAQVTGSFVLAAAAIVTNEPGALTKLLAIPVFLLAAVTTTILAVMLERHGRAALAWVLGLECAVLTGFLLTALIGRPVANPNPASVTAAGNPHAGRGGGGEPARLVRKGPRGRRGARVEEGGGRDQGEDHDPHEKRHRRDRAAARRAGAPPRARRCRGRGGLRYGARALRRTVCDHARVSGRDGGRRLGLRGDRGVGSPAPARDHVRDLGLGERAAGSARLPP